jgi:hypothetical protein
VAERHSGAGVGNTTADPTSIGFMLIQRWRCSITSGVERGDVRYQGSPLTPLASMKRLSNGGEVALTAVRGANWQNRASWRRWDIHGMILHASRAIPGVYAAHSR